LLITRRRKLAAFAAFGAIAFALIACGGGSSGGGTTPGTPSGTYNLKIKGTDGELVHDTTVSLTVK
jgi:hypothetical protein